jgi:hypothetical protein
VNAFADQRLLIGAAALALVFLVALSVAVLAILAMAAADAIRRIRIERRYDLGPRGNALWADLDAHLDEFLDDNPDIAAGLDRLRTAIRDEQPQGDQ